MRTLLLAVVLAGCGTQSTTGAALTFDPCDHVQLAAPGATAEQLASIDDALALWRARGVSTLARSDAAGVAPDVSIVFRDAADAMYGFYDDTSATVYVNLRLDDPSKRAITIAHELGHALGLVHVAPATRVSVMNPGNLTIAPNDGDRAALSVLWGACSVAP